LKAKHYDNAKSQQDAFTVALEAGKREREQIDAEVEELESQIEFFFKQKSDSSNQRDSNIDDEGDVQDDIVR
jgi:predicted  nucleic acid-binding Zn-ribbon protein